MMTGGCRCGACRYTLAVDAMPPVYCCHCQICQTTSGSAFSEQAVVPEAASSVTGPLIDYLYTTVSGARSHHRICGECHTRLWNTNALRPGIALVRAGTLDDAEHIAPRAHIWVKRKQPWIAIPDGMPQWPESAPLAELAKALQA
jgi:hypothetical protein